mgnify:CR=1 FL=1
MLTLVLCRLCKLVQITNTIAISHIEILANTLDY